MTEYRIYAASLSDYNAGRLHGAWIDCDGKDAEDLQEEVNAILRMSAYPNVIVECPQETLGDALPEGIACAVCGGIGEHAGVNTAEEYAIHDHEGFGNLIGEYTGLAEVAAIVEALESVDEPEALKEFAENYGYDIKEAAERFGDAYAGQFASERAYAEDYLDSTGLLEDMPDRLSYYFDYDAYARDLFLDGMTRTDGGYVFHDNH